MVQYGFRATRPFDAAWKTELYSGHYIRPAAIPSIAVRTAESAFPFMCFALFSAAERTIYGHNELGGGQRYGPVAGRCCFPFFRAASRFSQPPGMATGSSAPRHGAHSEAAPAVKRKKVTWPQARAFSVHLLTASGSFLAFLSLVAASEERWPAMFWWLGLALFVDGIDGPIARKLQVKEILPTWSGAMLDNVIDYVTYVLIPAFALYQRGFMGPGLSFTSAALIVITSAIYYADTGMKTKENFFKGFPVVWNMLVFTLFVIEPGEYASFAAVAAAAILTFVPMNFLHPVRVKRLREINLPVFLLWCLFGILALLEGMEAPRLIKFGIAITGIYLFFIGGIMQMFPKLGLKGRDDGEGDPHP
jgi:phosphatidylcholine synthase